MDCANDQMPIVYKHKQLLLSNNEMFNFGWSHSQESLVCLVDTIESIAEIVTLFVTYRRLEINFIFITT